MEPEDAEVAERGGRRAPLLERLGLHRPELRAWALYDWANSAFWTVIVTAVFPVWFGTVVAVDLPPERRTNRLAVVTTITLLVVAVLAPVLGAIADVARLKKRMLAGFVVLGSAATTALVLVDAGQWRLALALFFVGNVGVVSATVFYDALLPHVARPHELDRVSTTGFALGYLGGAIVLGAGLLAITRPELLGLPGEGSDLPARLAMAAVGPWWAGFTLPLLLRVPEPPAVAGRVPSARLLRDALASLGRTLRDLVRLRAAFLMLLAFLAYNDGIGTIIRLATIYGTELGLEHSVLVGAILLVQIVGIPATLAFGALTRVVSTRTAILLALAVYTGVAGLAANLETARGFVVMAVLVGLVQGGCQALSRSLFASLVPRQRSAELFGLFAVFDRFAGVLGPWVFVMAQEAFGSSRVAIGVLAGFFVVGAALLCLVDVEGGRRAARAAEAEIDARAAEGAG